MRRWEVRNQGIDGLELTSAPDPTPGPREVLVRVRATSLNYRDLMTVEGRYRGQPAPVGLVPLSDGAGEVVAVGEGTTAFRIGDRVAGNFFQAWHAGPWRGEYIPSALGGGRDGTLTELVVFSEGGTVALPEGYSFEEGATLPCAALTAWNALITKGQLQPGQTVLVQGTGGVSIFALQIALAVGASVIATTSSNEKAERLKAMGARAVVNYKENPDWEKAVYALTDKRGVDVVCEVGGAGTLERSIRALAHGGNISLVGVLAGGAGANPFGLAMKFASMHGIYVGSSSQFADMNAFFSAHGIRPIIDKVYPFTDAKAAFAHLKSGAHFGKVVIALPGATAG